jgi:hypothetical protein
MLIQGSSIYKLGIGKGRTSYIDWLLKMGFALIMMTRQSLSMSTMKG